MKLEVKELCKNYGRKEALKKRLIFPYAGNLWTFGTQWRRKIDADQHTDRKFKSGQRQGLP